MPLIIPKTLPAYDALYEENVFVMHRERAASQHIRPLEILILNLMPTKIATETQIARLLANTPLQVHMTLLQTVSHEATHVSAAHLDAFYKTFDEVKERAAGRGGVARTKWSGSLECELKMKEQAGVSSRCMPLKQSGTTGKCVCCGKECTTDIYWGVAY